MPFPNFHSVRLKNPTDFNPDTLRTTAGGKVEKANAPTSVIVVSGRLNTAALSVDKMLIQSLRFRKNKWSLSQVKRWLSVNDIKYLLIEPASRIKESFVNSNVESFVELLEQIGAVELMSMVTKLSKDSFLWVGDAGDPKTWKLPYREGAGGIDPETGRFMRAGEVVIPALTIIASMIQKSETDEIKRLPVKLKKKVRRLARQYNIESQEQKMNDNLIESYAANPISQTEEDKTLNVLRGVSILTELSKNGKYGKRRYMDKALQQTAELINGRKAYIDHNKNGSSSRNPKEVLGEFFNGQVGVVGNKKIVKADIRYLPTEKTWFEGIVAQMPNSFGFSIHGRGSCVGNSQLKEEQVMDMIGLSSADLVTDPGSTNSLYESKDDEIQGEAMDYNLITLSELRESRPDLLEAINANVKSSLDQDKKKTEMAKTISELEESNKTLKGEIDAYKVKEAAKERLGEIETYLTESKIAEEFITKDFKESIFNLNLEKDFAKKLIDERKTLVEGIKKGVTGSGDSKTLFENKDNSKSKAEEMKSFAAVVNGGK